MGRYICSNCDKDMKLAKKRKYSNDPVIEKELVYHYSCKCGKQIIKIEKTDIWGEKLPIIDVKSKNIDNFLESTVLIPLKEEQYQEYDGRFYLNYGKLNKKKGINEPAPCYQSFSNMGPYISKNPLLDLLEQQNQPQRILTRAS